MKHIWKIDLMHWRHVSITTTPCWGSRLVALRACVVLAERIGAQPLSQCAGLGQPGGMACRGWASGCMLGDSARGSASFDPQHTGAPFCDVICIWSIKRMLLPKRRKMWWNRKRSHFRNHRNCSLRTSTKCCLFRTFDCYSISKAGYVTTVLAIVRTELRDREASSFCDFWKMTSCEFTFFYSFLTRANIIFF